MREPLLVDDPALLVPLRGIGAAGRRFRGPRRPSPRVLVTALGALGVVAVGGALHVWGIPAASSVVASILPVSWEDRIGRAAVAQLAPSERRCLDPALQATVDAIVARLVVRAPDTYRIRVTIVDHPAVNAFAAPGGLRMRAPARVDPRGLSSSLGQLVPAEKGAPPALAYFASPPATAERITTLQRLAAEVRDTPPPIVTSRDWKDIARLCGA